MGRREAHSWLLRSVGAVVVATVSGQLAAAGVEANAAQHGSEVGTVHAASVAGVGTVLVDSAGRTLYVFSPDKQRTPTCTGACATAWPPLMASGKPVAGHGVRAARLGTVKAPDGKLQVTYDRWPLYTFVEDTGRGQAHGQGVVAFGGKWSTITSAGRAFGSVSSTHSSTTTTKASGGYGY